MSKRLLPCLLALALICAASGTASGAPPTARASQACGSFHASGLLTRVHVRVTNGTVSCTRARRVMRMLFAGGANRTIEGWHCVGPQTGYAACTKRARRIEADF